MRLRLPLFLVLEGIDGSGKSTLAALLAKYYAGQGLPVVCLREPTDGVWGRQIRAMLGCAEPVDPAIQLDLFIKDREDDMRRNIQPALDRNSLIIMDRYYYSNAAYQGAQGIDPKDILAFNRAHHFPEPDRVYLIDIEPARALQRIAGRNGSNQPELFEKAQLLDRVRSVYHAIADDRFVMIDGEDSLQEIVAAIIDDIEDCYTRV